MFDLEGFLFNSHQYFLGTLLITFFLIAWHDLKTSSYKIWENTRFTRIHVVGLIILLIILGAGVFQIVFEYSGYKGIFLSIELALIIVLSVYNPRFALAFFVFLFISRPWEFFNNEYLNYIPRDFTQLMVVVFIIHSIIRKEYFINWNRGCTLLFGFVVLSCVSAIIHGSAVLFFKNYTQSILAFMFIIMLVKHKRDLLPVKMALILAIAEQGVNSFVYSHFETKIVEMGDSTGDRLSSLGMMGNSNDAAALFVALLPFVFMFFWRIRNKAVAILLGTVPFAYFLYLMIQTQSRGALLSCFSMLLLYFFIRIKNKKRFLVIMAILLIPLKFSFDYMSSFRADAEASSDVRKNVILSGLHMAVRNPVFGVGYEMFPANVQQYAINPLSEEGHRASHSTWIQVLAENGWLAFLLFISFWAVVLKRAWALRITDPEYLYSMVGYGVAISFLSHSYILFPYILTGVTLAAYSAQIKGKIKENTV